MALTVEDGTGLANADSYVSIADVTAHLTKFETSATVALWTGETTADQERACRGATRYLDLTYGSRYPGRRINETMSLAWPRSEVYDSDGYLLDDDALPTALVEACCDLAYRLSQGADPLADQSSPATIASESVTVGPITTSKTYLGGKSTIARTSYPTVSRTMAKLLLSGNTVYPG